MMDLEQGRGMQALFQKPERPLIKISTARLPELGGKEGQVKRRREHYEQEERAQAELAEELDQDDEELVQYLSRVVGLKIWDFDENHNRFQIKDVAYDSKQDFFQAEYVFLNADESIDARHTDRGDGTYSNMAGYRFTGPGVFTIHSLENMAKDYDRGHAKPPREARKRSRLPVRRDEIDECSLRRSKMQRPCVGPADGAHLWNFH